MNERLTYTELAELVEWFSGGGNIKRAVEAVKEILELPEVNIPWEKGGEACLRHIYYYASESEQLPRDVKMFKIVFRREAKDYGFYF